MHRTSIALAVLAPALAMAGPEFPDPANAKAAVPPLRYESVIPSTQAPDAKPGSWKELNEAVGRLGGHGGHLKAIESPPPPAKDPPAGAGGPRKR